MDPDEQTEAQMAAVRAELELLKATAERKAAATKRARASSRKGGRGESALVEIAHAHGFTGAYRKGRAGGVDVKGIPGIALECKRVEKINVHKAFEQAQRLAQPTDTPVLAFKRNHGPWLAVIELDELFALLKLREL